MISVGLTPNFGCYAYPKVALSQALADNLRSVERGQLQLFEFSYTRSVHGLSGATSNDHGMLMVNYN